MNKNSLITLVIAITVFAAGVSLQYLGAPNVKDGKAGGGMASGDLAKKLPMTLSSWVGRNEPLGPSEFVSDAASRILNFDDYVYRIYTSGSKRVGVYVAYWQPGRMPTHKVASHTPDRCWVENGWTCVDAKFDVDASPSGMTFKPAQERLFNPPQGTPQHVLYWHLVGDEVYDYGQRLNTRPHPVKWVRDSLAYAAKGSQAQYFIRITSDDPIEPFLNDPGLNELWQILADIGLARVHKESTPARQG